MHMVAPPTLRRKRLPQRANGIEHLCAQGAHTLANSHSSILRVTTEPPDACVPVPEPAKVPHRLTHKVP